jgi:Spy/CpxP family protein refolding chaperone
MKKRTGIITALIAALAICAVPFVYAQHPGHGEGHGFGRPGGSMLIGHLMMAQAYLGLSDGQVTQIKTIATDLRTQNEPYRTQIHSGLQGIAATLIANPSDVAKAQAQLDAQDAAERVMKTNTLNAAAKALAVLTADQRAKLATKLAEHAAHSGSHEGAGF